jgi:hypothetical protein
MLAAHMAAPREGHLRAVFQVFDYLKLKYNARLIYDPCPITKREKCGDATVSRCLSCWEHAS